MPCTYMHNLGVVSVQMTVNNCNYENDIAIAVTWIINHACSPIIVNSHARAVNHTQPLTKHTIVDDVKTNSFNHKTEV